MLVVVGALVAGAACAAVGEPSAGEVGGVDAPRADRFAQQHGFESLPRAVVRIDAAGSGTARVAHLEVVVADTPASRARGLQGVTDVPHDVGMLFVFPEPEGPAGRPGFWMLDTLVPLDIAFVEAGIVVGVASMTPCRARPCPVSHPGVPFDMALEVVAGGLTGAGVAAGDRIVVTR